MFSDKHSMAHLPLLDHVLCDVPIEVFQAKTTKLWLVCVHPKISVALGAIAILLDVIVL